MTDYRMSAPLNLIKGLRLTDSRAQHQIVALVPAAPGWAGVPHPDPLACFWTHLTGWHRDITLVGSGHDSFTDLEAFYPRSPRSGGFRRTWRGSCSGRSPRTASWPGSRRISAPSRI